MPSGILWTRIQILSGLDGTGSAHLIFWLSAAARFSNPIARPSSPRVGLSLSPVNLFSSAPKRSNLICKNLFAPSP